MTRNLEARLAKLENTGGAYAVHVCDHHKSDACEMFDDNHKRGSRVVHVVTGVPRCTT